MGILEGDDLAGDGEGGGEGVSGEKDSGPPSVVVEGLDDVVEAERLRVGGRRGAGADVGGGEGFDEGTAGVVGEEMGVGDGVAGPGAAAARREEAVDFGLEPGAVEAVVVDADLDLGARRQGRLLGKGRRGGRGRGLRATGGLRRSAPASAAAPPAAGGRRRAAGHLGGMGVMRVRGFG